MMEPIWNSLFLLDQLCSQAAGALEGVVAVAAAAAAAAVAAVAAGPAEGAAAAGPAGAVGPVMLAMARHLNPTLSVAWL